MGGNAISISKRYITAILLALGFMLPGALAGAEPAPGAWGKRAPMLEANSEFAVAVLGGKIYIVGGYPSSRETQRTVQIYDTKTDSWTLGPPLPQPNNHGTATTVGGKIYVIGGQTTSRGRGSYVDTVYVLDPKTGQWEEKAPMPTKRSAAITAVIDGMIYVAGGRPPRGSDFAVYDPKTDTWKTLPDLPTQRNHIAGAAINGKFHVVGGRPGGGFRSGKIAAHEVFDPKTRTWSAAAPMLQPRSGINGVMARGCFHVWGGEEGSGMFPDHDYYDPRTDKWMKLADMKIPVHGVTGAVFQNGLIYVPGGGTEIGGSSGSLFNQVYRPAVSCE
jgi:N-acetylneuraminic acid mutarotase